VVEVFDVRSAVKDEVRSLGGKFIEVEGAREDATAGGYAVEQTEEFRKKQQDLIQQRAAAADVIIATAQIPGRRAPVLVLKETVARMKPGSVIIDLAASTGGNCELTRDGKTVIADGVTIVGRSDYPAAMSSDASRMFGNNLVNLLRIMTDRDGNVIPDLSDEIVAGTTAVSGGEYRSPRVKQLLDIKQN
jgi:NAD(P) transhydrogenase subunit alpha